MSQDFQEEFLRGLQLALRGEHAKAIEAFERSRRLNPDALDPALNLMESYQEEGLLAEADVVAGELLELWPNEHAALFSVAKLREAQGRPTEAFELIRRPHFDVSGDSLAFPFYLRVLIENQRYQEADNAAKAALKSSTLWRPHAVLTRIITLLQFKEYDKLRRYVAEFDVDGFTDLVNDCAAHMRQAGALKPVKKLFDDGQKQLSDDGKFKKLSACFSA